MLLLILGVAGVALVVGGALLAADYQAVAHRLQTRYDQDVLRMPSWFRGTTWMRSSTSWRIWGLLLAVMGLVITFSTLSAFSTTLARPFSQGILVLLLILSVGIILYATLGFSHWWAELQRPARGAIAVVTFLAALLVIAAYLWRP